MIKVRKINPIEVKRGFVVSQLIRKQKGKKRYLGLLSREDFEKKLKIAKTKTLKFSDKKLDKIISNEWKKRTKAYNNSDWYLGEVSPKEVGVWKGSGGLPLKWTDTSLSETAKRVKNALDKNSGLLAKRARHTISNILETNVDYLQKEKYLFPIIFKSGTGTNERKGLKKKMKGDIDDGCMRSISLAIKGVDAIKVYLGFPKD